MLTCRVWHLRAGENVVVRLRSRLWNSTLVEEFGRSTRGVSVEVAARLLLRPEAEALQDPADDAAVARLAALSALPPEEGAGGLWAVPGWAVAAAIAVGVLLVSSGILRKKCGSFLGGWIFFSCY